jgi:endogenous inhibitor of DNA gyrase (YacG/DUF329 family)
MQATRERMTVEQKELIAKLRTAGISYGRIAADLELSKSTVKSYCQRNNIIMNACKNCDKPIVQSEGHKKKKFCSAECRIAWWKANPTALDKKAVYDFTCAACGKNFTAYGNKSRKYCSHACYISTRYGGGEK